VRSQRGHQAFERALGTWRDAAPDRALAPRRVRRADRPRVVAVALLLLTGFAASALADGRDGPRRPAVAALNARVSAGYDYTHVDETDTSFSNSTSSGSLRIDEFDGHSVGGELVGSAPIWRFIGARGRFRAAQRDTRRPLDALGTDDSDVTSYGAAFELLLRDPDLGSLALGGGYDRLDGDGSQEADAYTGSVDAAIYFPDLGAGPLDWFARFDFSHRQVSGTGQSFDIDADVYRVAGGAGWYPSDDFRFALGGRWTRTEEEFLSEVDTEGFVSMRWKLPLPVSLELAVEGSGGISEYKEAPFRGDHRLIYGAQVGLVYRFRSGATLLESIRAYD